MVQRIPGLILFAVLFSGGLSAAPSTAVFNIKDYGATGIKTDNAQPAIQKAIEACAAAGGGVVYFPPGKPTLRSFPKPNATPKMFLLIRCKDVRVAGLSLLRSPSWTMHPVGCERVVVDGVTIRTSLEDGVWADGIDPDGCKDVRIANCTIETGDDAIVFYSMNWYGPATPCENITVTNCRLSSASSAIKFCDGNMNCVRKVTISNCVITDSNRGIAFMVFDGGYVSDVVISDLTIDCRRHKWFWWGDGDPFHFNIKRRSEIMNRAPQPGEPPAGSIRNVKLSNIIARGKGSSLINGHPDSWLDGVT
ncbi:MAG: glycosyl hydrolase family 28 protein, partial [Sedimentisphaerales bacterium]|nr:glycosyl hydrolase family 28 protein [Sedimentisphaerales bacterium]